MERQRRSDAELRNASEHVGSEMEHLFGALHDLFEFSDEPVEQLPWTQEALAVSWAIHLRNIMHFMHSERSRASDIVAADFFEDDEWIGLLGARRAEGWGLTEERLDWRINKQIMHLTYDRLSLAPTDADWDMIPITWQIAHDIRLFINEVPSGRVVSDFKPRIWTALGTIGWERNPGERWGLT